jgi:hypothetical protein
MIKLFLSGKYANHADSDYDSVGLETMLISYLSVIFALIPFMSLLVIIDRKIRLT